MLKLVLLTSLVALAIDVLAVQLGAPLTGAPRPHLGRTVLTVLATWVAVVVVSLVLALPLGCLGAVAGAGVTMLIGLVTTVLTRGLLYDFLLGLGLVRATVLAAAGTVLGWGLQAAAFTWYLAWSGAFS